MLTAKNNSNAELTRVEALMEIWSMRPAPNSPEGRAWEDGCRQGFKWRSDEKKDSNTTKEQYEELMHGETELSNIERLRLFCSLAMTGQDWIDVEPLFNELSNELSKK